MYSAESTLTGGFPHSEIPGSKLYCQLPETYRRLTRLSSPVAAKASTLCAWSLDPITLKHHHLINHHRARAFQQTSLRQSVKQQHRVIGVYENLIRRTFNPAADVDLFRDYTRGMPVSTYQKYNLHPCSRLVSSTSVNKLLPNF